MCSARVQLALSSTGLQAGQGSCLCCWSAPRTQNCSPWPPPSEEEGPETRRALPQPPPGPSHQFREVWTCTSAASASRRVTGVNATDLMPMGAWVSHPRPPGAPGSGRSEGSVQRPRRRCRFSSAAAWPWGLTQPLGRSVSRTRSRWSGHSLSPAGSLLTHSEWGARTEDSGHSHALHARLRTENSGPGLGNRSLAGRGHGETCRPAATTGLGCQGPNGAPTLAPESWMG